MNQVEKMRESIIVWLAVLVLASRSTEHFGNANSHLAPTHAFDCIWHENLNSVDDHDNDDDG